MPTITVPRANVTRDEAIAALRPQLDARVKLEPSGSPDVFEAKTGTLSGAKVHIRQHDGATQFHVHGTGIIIGRIINELTIARRVAAALDRASATLAAPPSPPAP